MYKIKRDRLKIINQKSVQCVTKITKTIRRTKMFCTFESEIFHRNNEKFYKN